MRLSPSQTTVLWLWLLLLASAWASIGARADGLPDTIARVKPAIVGIGIQSNNGPSRSELRGTGFAVADGYHVITNAHVVNHKLSKNKKEQLVVFVGHGKTPDIRQARVLVQDDIHDLALLRIHGRKLPVMKIADSDRVREGRVICFYRVSDWPGIGALSGDPSRDYFQHWPGGYSNPVGQAA